MIQKISCPKGRFLIKKRGKNMLEIIKRSPNEEEQRSMDASSSFVGALPKEGKEAWSIPLLGRCARMNDSELLGLLKGLRAIEENWGSDKCGLNGVAVVAKRLEEFARARGLSEGPDDGDVLK